MNATDRSRRVFSLQAVTKRLKSILGEVESKRFWVRAQFVPGNARRRSTGHLYGMLIEADKSGATVAQMKAVIWADDRERILQKLLKAGQPDALAGNQEISALCQVRFHPVYGLSLQITDVDVETGESQLDRNRREILERLRSAGLLELNGRHQLTRAPLRVGLITAQGSAAYEDFSKTIGASGFAFEVHLVTASMQGDGMLPAVLNALEALEARDLDVICIVRGGGSAIDLACFNHERLGERIARCRRPVWIGIGHEIDVTVPDFVAHSTFKTPTAVAMALVQHVQALVDALGTAEQQLREVCRRHIENAEYRLEQNDNGLRQGTRKFLELKEERFSSRARRLRDAVRRHQADRSVAMDRAEQRLKRTALETVRLSRDQLNQAAQKIMRDSAKTVALGQRDLDHAEQKLRRAPQLLKQQLQVLDHRTQRLADLDPQRILERGYSVTRNLSGRILKDAAEAETGQAVVTQLAQGQLISIITEEVEDVGATVVVRGEGTTPQRDTRASGPVGDSDG